MPPGFLLSNVSALTSPGVARARSLKAYSLVVNTRLTGVGTSATLPVGVSSPVS
jgi:hypothetical protein